MACLNSEILRGISIVLLDIEGTTTPISFVKDILFGFVRSNLHTYVDKYFSTEQLQNDIEALRTQVVADKSEGSENVDEIPEYTKDSDNREAVISAVIKNVLSQMDRDRKTTSLKQLQGHMWRIAYENGQIQGAIFDDVVPALQKFTSSGLRICIYSSGSVEAQKLLFGHSSSGDLLMHLSGFYDTNIGAKVAKESYSKIAASLEVAPSEVLFFTDVPAEAAAAKAAGLSVCLVSRPGNAPLTDDDKQTYRVITSFNELF